MAEPGRARVALRCLSAGLFGFALGSLLLHGSGGADGQQQVQDPAVTMATQHMQPTGARLPMQSFKPNGILRVPPVSAPVSPWKPEVLRGDDVARHHTIAMAKMERGMNRGGGQPKMRPKIPNPPVDPDNEEFVVFVRSKRFGPWVPCTMVKGSSVANQLVKAIDQQLSRDTLIRNVGTSVYENQKDLMKGAVKAAPNLAVASAVEFGFKVRDKTKPEEWYMPKDIIVLPPKDDLPKAPLDGVGNAIDNVKDSFSKMFRGSR